MCISGAVSVVVDVNILSRAYHSLAIEACIASYPGLFIPVSVACSINVEEEDLVKMITCSDIPVHNLWRVAYSFCTDVWLLSEPKKHHQDYLMSTAHSLHSLWLQSIVHSLTVPNIQVQHCT